MREILFRGQDAVTREWIYGCYVDNRDRGRYPPIIVPKNGNPHIYVVPETVGQYTGLKDCNGKMIFEGDIVKITYHSMEETFESCGDLVTMLMTRTYEVFWNATKWSIKSLEPMLAVYPPIFDLPTNHVTYEIIGNIHEEEKK